MSEPTPPVPPTPPSRPITPIHAAGRNRRREGRLRPLRRRRCTACTPSGAAPRAATRPTAAAGNALPSHHAPRVLMRALESHVDTASEIFTANRDRMQQLVQRAARTHLERARQGGGPKYLQRHREQGKLPVRERIDRLLDPGSPFLELSAARRLRHVRRRSARRPGIVTGHRPRLGPRGADRRQRRDGQGRHLLSDHRQEAPARAADRAREPAAVRLPRRFGRRVPAAAGRGLSRSRALRPHLLQPGAHVGRADPADRRRHGLVHGRRRVRAGDVRRDDHRQRHRARSSSAVRRSSKPRPAKKSRPKSSAAPTSTRASPASPTTSPTTTSTRSTLCRTIVSTLQHGEAPARRHRRARRAAVRSGGDLRHRQRRHPEAVRRARNHRAPRRRLALRRVQGALRRRRSSPASRACTDSSSASSPTTACSSPSRRSRRRTSSSCATCAASRSSSCRTSPASWSAGSTSAAGIAKDGAKMVHAVANSVVPKFTVDHRRLVRRRQLRHVRPRVRAAAAVDVAERAHLGDGRRTGGRRADDGQARSARARAASRCPPEDEAGDPRADPRRSTSTKDRPTTPPPACGTTAFSIRRRRARRSRSGCRPRSTRRSPSRDSACFGCEAREPRIVTSLTCAPMLRADPTV